MTQVTTVSSDKMKKSIKNKYSLSTEIFKKTPVSPPDLIKNHQIFKDPIKIKKIFPSLGLPNCKEEANMVVPPVDLKKADNFVYNLIKVMYEASFSFSENIGAKADLLQWSFDDDADNSKTIDELFEYKKIVDQVISQLDYKTLGADKIASIVSGQIELKLHQDVIGANGKTLYKKGFSFFKVFAKFKEKASELNIEFINLDQTPQFKTFNVENIASKKYTIVFSSDGEEGGWDLLTMSMRGIKSCQRWNGEYPRCLVGSIISKYIGIIYLTTGSDHEGYGTRMIRRAIVRYVIDAVEKTPALLIDKMYSASGQETHEETLSMFTNFLKKKTNLPVYYGPDLKNKARHLYIPFEKNREKVPEKEWSYQDTAIKTNLDMQIYTMSVSCQEEFNRYVSALNTKMIIGLNEALRKTFHNRNSYDKEIYRTISSIKMDYGFDRFASSIVGNYVYPILESNNSNVKDAKIEYKKFLMKAFLKKKQINESLMYNHKNIILDYESIPIESIKKFFNFVTNQLLQTIKHEYASI